MLSWILRYLKPAPQLPFTGYFVHIPKCAGTAVIQSLSRLPQSRWIILSQSPDSKQQANQDLMSLINQRKTIEPLSLIAGHDVHFGLADLPSLQNRPSFFFTFLRDPVQRYLSHYRYLVQCTQNPDHPLHLFAVDLLGSGGLCLTLSEYIEQKRMPNLMTQYLGAANDGDLTSKRWTLPDPALWKNAQQALEKLDFIGTQETLNDDLQQLCLRFQLPSYNPRTNVTSGPSPSIDRTMLQKIQDLNHLDIQLYEAAIRRRSGGQQYNSI